MNIAKADCETLLNVVLPFARQMLQRHGEFYPFGATMMASGKVVPVAGFDDRNSTSAELIDLLKQGFIQGALSGEYKATALAYDARVVLPSSNQKTDAIAVSLNHRDSYSIVVFFPYSIENGQLSEAEVFTQKGEVNIFPSNGSD